MTDMPLRRRRPHSNRAGNAPLFVLLLAAAAVALFAPEPGSGAMRDAVPSEVTRRDGACGVSGGRFDIGWPVADSADTDGHCEGDFANYQGVASWAFAQINTTRKPCDHIREFLYYDATLFEWTGWLMGENWLDAGTWDKRVGLHWSWMDSVWLWVHEGAIAVLNAGEVEAGALADLCNSHW